MAERIAGVLHYGGDEFVVSVEGFRRPDLYRMACMHDEVACPFDGLDVTQQGARLQSVPRQLRTPRILIAMANDYLDGYTKMPPIIIDSFHEQLYDQEKA